MLLTNATNYSKGILSEILEFVMGQGMIPADGDVWKMRRRAIVPALHRKYITSMVNMFGDSMLHGTEVRCENTPAKIPCEAQPLPRAEDETEIAASVQSGAGSRA